MKRGERALMSQLYGNVDSYGMDFADPSVQAAAPVVAEMPTDPAVIARAGNPPFKAQFDLDIQLLYFTEAAGVYTAIASGGLDGSLQNLLPVFLFGTADFAGGYKNLIQKFPVNGWTYGRPFIFGADEPDAAYDANVTNLLQRGDLVIPFTATVGPTNFVGLVRVRCKSVAYGTLLDASGSDRFVINMLRYVVDQTATSQYSEQINIVTQSLFGKGAEDFVSPNSYKIPEQFQNGIVDIRIRVPVDKHKSLASYVEYDATDNSPITWSIFVSAVAKLNA